MGAVIEINQRVLELVDCGVVIHALDGQIVGCNRRAWEVLGISRDQLIGSASMDPRWNVIDEEGAPLPGDRHPAMVALRTGEAVSDRLMGVFRPTTGDRAWLLVTARPKHGGPNGEMNAVVVTFNEVTGQHRAEQARREEHALHREVMSTVLAGITLLDPEGRVLYANPRAEAILGLERSRIEGRSYDDPAWQIQALDGGPMPSAALPFARVRATRAPVNDVMHAIRWPDGRRRVLNINGAPILDEEGGLRHLVFALHDHTELHDKELALQEATSRLSFAVAAAELGVIEGILGPAGGAVQIDAAWIAQHGSLSRPCSIEGWTAPLSLLDEPKLKAAFDAIGRKESERLDVELRFTDRAGAPRTARLMARAFAIDNDPSRVRVAGVLRDVTAERLALSAAEAERHRAAELNRLRSLSVMAGGVAHEFNNLLVSILAGASSALDELPEDAPARAMIELIAETGQRAAALTRQLLAYSGEGRFSVERLRINELIGGIAEGLSQRTEPRVRFALSLAAAPTEVEGDASQLRQAIFNVVINAVEAVSDTGGQVNLRLLRLPAGAPPPEGLVGPELEPLGEHLVLEVEDSGAGIPPELRASIFEPFTTTKAGRQGLGLPAALGVVRGHRGWIAVEHLARGTRVRIGLPACAAEPPALATPIRPIRVLLVDDEEMVRRVCIRVLQRAEMTVVEAVHGAEALSLYHANPDDFDVVLLDLVMPVMDGEQTFLALRKLNPNLPVLLMSGYSRAELVGRAIGQGACGFLPKPFTSRDLVAAVREVLDDAALAVATWSPR